MNPAPNLGTLRQLRAGIGRAGRPAGGDAVCNQNTRFACSTLYSPISLIDRRFTRRGTIDNLVDCATIIT